jgi:CHAT domain-containing protein
MVKFYQFLTQKKLSKAESLRQSQLELLQHSQFSHPYYWAPFILVGNWL